MKPKEKLVIKADGTWTSNGEVISHAPTLALFSKSLFRTPQGIELRIGHEKAPVKVEDTLYFVTHVSVSSSEVSITLSDGERETLNLDSLSYTEGRLSCKVHRRGEQEEARFLWRPYHELLALAEEDQTGLKYIQLAKIKVFFKTPEKLRH